jgi:arylsulfatase
VRKAFQDIEGLRGSRCAAGHGGLLGVTTPASGAAGRRACGDGPHGAADLGTDLSADHRTRRQEGRTPFTWTKQVASSVGGTPNGMVAYWPKRITARGEVRSQFHHVIDVAPTVLEAAKLPEPKVVNGTP